MSRPMKRNDKPLIGDAYRQVNDTVQKRRERNPVSPTVKDEPAKSPKVTTTPKKKVARDSRGKAYMKPEPQIDTAATRRTRVPNGSKKTVRK